MASYLKVPDAAMRPSLARSRSSSSPSATRDGDKNPPSKDRPRPGHVRSHSYMSPVEAKPKNAATFPHVQPEKPAEVSRFHRLHLPGRHHNHSVSKDEQKPVDRTQTKRHRYTQSEAQQYHRKKDSPVVESDSSATPALTTTPASPSMEPPNDMLYPASRGTAIPSLMRMASTRSHRAYLPAEPSNYSGLGLDIKPSLRRRATSDPRFPTVDTSQNQVRSAYKSPIEIAVERADLLRRAALDNMTASDLQRTDAKILEATHELQDRVTDTSRAASDLMRRLDDAQETLLRTTESLTDTISSFTNLTDQSTKLMTNFRHESKHLDDETRRRISHFRNSIAKKRAKRVEELERRSRATNQKAEELGRRLENCRTIVRNWEERERNKRRAWRGVWVGIVWGVALILVAVVAGVASWKAADVSRSAGSSGEKVRHATVRNASYDVSVLRDLDIPDHVKDVLLDIDARAREGNGQPISASSPVDVARDANKNVKSDGMEDQRIRLFDEL